MMDGAREQFFAGAALAQQEHCGVGGGDTLDLLAHFLQGLVFAHNLREAVARRVFLA